MRFNEGFAKMTSHKFRKRAYPPRIQNRAKLLPLGRESTRTEERIGGPKIAVAEPRFGNSHMQLRLPGPLQQAEAVSMLRDSFVR